MSTPACPGRPGSRRAPQLSATADRAVKAAERQSAEAAAALLRALRESCFVHCEPADTLPRVLALAATVDAVDAERLRTDFDRDEVVAAFIADREETRRAQRVRQAAPGDARRQRQCQADGDGWRYAFPTIVFRGSGGERTVPGWQPWAPTSTHWTRLSREVQLTLVRIPTLDDAQATWPTMTEHEVDFLCGSARPVAG